MTVNHIYHVPIRCACPLTNPAYYQLEGDHCASWAEAWALVSSPSKNTLGSGFEERVAGNPIGLAWTWGGSRGAAVLSAKKQESPEQAKAWSPQVVVRFRSELCDV